MTNRKEKIVQGLVLCLLFLGLVFFVFYIGNLINAQQMTNAWNQAPVDEIKFSKQYDSESDEEYYVEYSFSIKDIVHKGKNFWFEQPNISVSDYENFFKDKTNIVFYDVKNPTKSCLRKGVSWKYILGISIFPTVFLFFIIIILKYSLKSGKEPVPLFMPKVEFDLKKVRNETKTWAKLKMLQLTLDPKNYSLNNLRMEGEFGNSKILGRPAVAVAPPSSGELSFADSKLILTYSDMKLDSIELDMNFEQSKISLKIANKFITSTSTPEEITMLMGKPESEDIDDDIKILGYFKDDSGIGIDFDFKNEKLSRILIYKD